MLLQLIRSCITFFVTSGLAFKTYFFLTYKVRKDFYKLHYIFLLKASIPAKPFLQKRFLIMAWPPQKLRSGYPLQSFFCSRCCRKKAEPRTCKKGFSLLSLTQISAQMNNCAPFQFKKKNHKLPSALHICKNILIYLNTNKVIRTFDYLLYNWKSGETRKAINELAPILYIA